MSLINDMLKDLESRRSDTHSNQEAVNGLVSAPYSAVGVGKATIRFAIIVAVFVLLLIAISWFFFFGQSKTKKTPAPQLRITSVKDRVKQKEPTSLTVLKANKTFQNAKPEQAKNDMVKTVSTTLSTIELSQNKNRVTLQFNLSHSIHYRIQTEESHEHIQLILSNTQLQPSFSAVPQHVLFKNIHLETVGENLQIDLDVLPGTKIESLTLSDQAPYHLDLVLVNQSIEEPQKTTINTTPSFQKTEVPPTISEKANLFYQKGLSFIARDEINSSISWLKKSLEVMPEFLPARETLATVLIKQDRHQEAIHYLREGLAKTPDSIELIKLYARILVQQHQFKRALTLLQRESPSLEDNAEYYSIMAFAEQGLGNADVAARLYERLLKFNPNHGNWWLGLALALETNGQPNSALHAYQRAAASGDLSPSVEAYIESKIEQIGN
jgi:tetratricopeptide (TPR) repeat protein